MSQPKETQIGEVGNRKTTLRRQLRTVILGGLFFGLGVAVDHYWTARTPANLTAPVSTALNAPVVEESTQPKAATLLVASPEIPPSAFDAVKDKIPNVSNVSIERGSDVLRQAAVSDFKTAIEELRGRQENVERQFAEAQKNHSEAQQKAAIEELRKLQAEQVLKLKEIAANSQDQVDALKQLKRSAQ